MKERQPKTNWKQTAREQPLAVLLIVLLLAAGVFLFPIRQTVALIAGECGPRGEMIGKIAVRVVFSALMILFLRKLDFFKLCLWKPSGKELLILLPFLIVAVNNAPIIALAGGSAGVSANAMDTALFVLMCLSVAMFEELVFRGIVFPLCLMKMKDGPRRIFWAAAVSSAIFGGMHLLNLLNGSVGSVLMQVGYAFLIGGMFAASEVVSRSVLPAIFLHWIYNAGGMLIDSVGFGMQWNPATIVLTAVIGVAAAIYTAALLWRSDGRGLLEAVCGGSKTEEKQENIES